MAGRPSDGIPPAGSGSDEIGRSELRLASVPLTSVTTPSSAGTRLLSSSVGSLGKVPTLPNAVVTLPRTQPRPKSVVTAQTEPVGAAPAPAPSPDPLSVVPPPGRSLKVAAVDSGSEPDCEVSHCSGAAFWVSEPDSDVRTAVTTAAVPLVAAPPFVPLADGVPSGETDDASGCAAAGAMVK